MLDGKKFFAVTGTPMRKMLLLIRPLALAETGTIYVGKFDDKVVDARL